MSTRSAIGTLDGHQFRGRFIHSDGHPGHMAWTLANLIYRDGLAAVMATLGARTVWSCLDAQKDHPEYLRGGDELIPGYGIAHCNDRDGLDPKKDWVSFDTRTGEGDTWDAELAYGVTPGGLLTIINICSLCDETAVQAQIPLTELVTDQAPYSAMNVCLCGECS